MYKKKTTVAVAILCICTVMLTSTGITSASKTTTTKKQTYHEEIQEKLTERINAFNMTNATKLQLIRILALGGVVALGGVILLTPNKHRIKVVSLLKIAGVSVCVGAGVAIGITILLNMPGKQNNTNSTI